MKLKTCIAEIIGTFLLVFIGTACVVTQVSGIDMAADPLIVGLAFGCALIAGIYAFGPISGGHFNPAVTFAFYWAKRIPLRIVFPYIVSQILGAILASFALWILVSSGVWQQDVTDFGSNGWDHTRYSELQIFLTEVFVTFVFVTVILAVTSQKHANAASGLVIGLTLAALHFAFVPVSGSSLNPARSLGPALFSGIQAVEQLWLYFLAPMLGGMLAGLSARSGLFEKD